MTKVIIAGGGVAGMSAAHELAERGFEVAVREKRSEPGGKARSIPVPGSGRDGRPDLPGEHGFRLFAGFYRNVTDTMSRIPVGEWTAFDNLTNATQVIIAQDQSRPVRVPAKSSLDPRVIGELIESILGPGILGELDDGEAEFFTDRLWMLITSCDDRRMAVYERQSWLEFTAGDTKSPAYRRLLVYGLTRSLVAAQAAEASAKVVGEILFELLTEIADPTGPHFDRILNGPTSEVWITPWLEHLRTLDVDYAPDQELVRIDVDHETQMVSAFVFRDNAGVEYALSGDAYLLAIPVERLAALLSESAQRPLLAAAPELAGLQQLAGDVEWMNGLQIYLHNDVPVGGGHALLLDSEWAVTGISQQQFWPKRPLNARGDGSVTGCYSVVISNWNAPGGLIPKPAKECSVDEIVREVQHELQRELSDVSVGFDQANIARTFLDPDITHVAPAQRVQWANSEPLFIATKDSWRLRPEAQTSISNLCLASDYVRTFTQLPTMEGANEAARRATNAIIESTGSAAEPCVVFDLPVPLSIRVLRWFDARNFRRNRPWDPELAWFVRVPYAIVHWFEQHLPTRWMPRRPAVS